MMIKIDGTDITKYIAYNGLKWSRNDVDDPDTGRALSGLMRRGRVATKIRMDITCRLLTAAEAKMLLNLIQPEYVTVTYDDFMYGRRTAVFYANNNSTAYQIRKPDGTEYLSGFTFPLVER